MRSIADLLLRPKLRRGLISVASIAGAMVCVGLAGVWTSHAHSLALAKDSQRAWTLTKESEAIVSDAKLRGQIFKALDAAEGSGTSPTISHFPVRAATVVEQGTEEHVVLGGNTEYEVPEAIHGETSVLNHVTALYGPEATRRVRFLAFYGEHCGGGGSCGDCRDYQLATTDWEHLLVACGQSSDHAVKVTRFSDQIVCERNFPEVAADRIPLNRDELDKLVRAAKEARLGGVTLFTSDRHTGAAGLSYSGKVYRAAGGDDAAFHYRYPIGGLLQQAATERDYFLKAIVVSGEKGKWPVVNYRDRQYGYEASSFNHEAGKEPIRLILTNGEGQYRMTSFENSLPNAFSTADFMPQALKEFIRTHRTDK
jgi:cytidine deaminase